MLILCFYYTLDVLVEWPVGASHCGVCMGNGTMLRLAYDFHMESLCGHDMGTDMKKCHGGRKLRVIPFVLFHEIMLDGMEPFGRH